MAQSTGDNSSDRRVIVDSPIDVGIFVDGTAVDVARQLPRTSALRPVFETGDLSDARAKTVASKPDAVVIFATGKGDGLTFLKELNRNWPLPVIVVNLTPANAKKIASDAMDMGAHLVIEQPVDAEETRGFGGKITRILWPLLRQGRVPGSADAAGDGSHLTLGCPVEPMPGPVSLIAIGGSTGGLRSLGSLLDHLPSNCPPILVVQHMKRGYIERTAARFDAYYPQMCSVAQDGRAIRPNQLQFAPDTCHLGVTDENGQPTAFLIRAEPTDHFVPAADQLFSSVADGFGSRAVGVILTGMGKDGAQGLKRMRQAGARCIGENEASCVVYGMPRVAKEAGAVDLELSADEIGLYLAELIRTSGQPRNRHGAEVFSRAG